MYLLIITYIQRIENSGRYGRWRESSVRSFCLCCIKKCLNSFVIKKICVFLLPVTIADAIGKTL